MIFSLIAAAMLAGSPMQAPAGSIAFCTRNPSFCDHHERASEPVAIMDRMGMWNARVNGNIVSFSLDGADARRQETQNWRTVMPGGIGDCVEYALTKYQLLAWSGVDQGAMEFAIVHRHQDALDMNHMVLLVRVARVWVVLDCLTNAILPADDTSFDWIEMSDHTAINPWTWNKLDGAPQ